jgi:hypothetical protein
MKRPKKSVDFSGAASRMRKLTTSSAMRAFRKLPAAGIEVSPRRFKRGMVGVYQHCDEAHLHRCLAEFDFRYNRRAKLGFTDQQRVDAIMAGIAGKGLTYRRIGEADYA